MEIPFLQRVSSRKALAVILFAAAAALLVCAYGEFRSSEPFRMPIAYTFANDRLFVLEKKRNTLLELDYGIEGERLSLLRRRRIEPDDARHYYMVRKLDRGPGGLIVLSYIYCRESRTLAGYRFREYDYDTLEPTELLTWWLPEKHTFPEIKYCPDGQGRPVFVHSAGGLQPIWVLDGPGRIVGPDGVIPEGISALGPTNPPLTSWADITTGPDGHFYVSALHLDQIVEFSPAGDEVRRIGRPGFEPGETLSPKDLDIIRLPGDDSPHLLVANSGNRNWVQFDRAGQVLRLLTPLEEGYPHADVLVSEIYPDTRSGALFSFDQANRCMMRVSSEFGIVESYDAVNAAPALLRLFLAVFLLGGGVHFWRVRRASAPRVRFFVKLLAIFIPLLAVSSLTVGLWVMSDMQRFLADEYARRSGNLARAIVNHLSLEDLLAVQRPEDRKSEAYLRIHGMVNNMLDREHVGQTPKWILHKVRDGKLYFGINIWGGALYEPYVLPPDRELFHTALETGKPVSGSFVDDQGEWFSWLEPILDDQGRVIYLLELYRDTEEMNRANREALLHIASIIGATVCVAGLLLLLFSFLITQPLKRLNAAAGLVSQGDFEHRVRAGSRDEIGDLGRAFNKMMADLKQYTMDLERSTAERERLAADMRLAREVQQGILPAMFPPMPGLEHIRIAARIKPAKEVCGDFFDFFKIDDDHVGVVIADVSGKGVSAGLFMMVARTLLVGNARHNLSPAHAITWTNRIMAAVNPSCMFVTMFYFIYNRISHEIRYCNAGHNPPLLIRNGQPARIMPLGPENARTGVAGVDMDAFYDDSSMYLNPDDRLILYTDGVVEPIDHASVMYGTERLLDLVNRSLVLEDEALCETIVRDVMDYQKGLEQFDDLTLLSFRPLDWP